jgi:hypothetical protein
MQTKKDGRGELNTRAEEGHGSSSEDGGRNMRDHFEQKNVHFI